MESEHLQSVDVSWGQEPVGIPLTRPAGTFSPTGGEGRDEGVRFMEGLHGSTTAHRDPELPVGRDSVEPLFDLPTAGEANAVSILPGPERKDARCARTVCDGRIDSTESCPTFRFMERKCASPATKRILKRACWSWIVIILALMPGCGAVGPHTGIRVLDERDIFVAGEHGYHTFRIPALISTKQGTGLAFCEGRKHSGSDSGDIDVVLRRSTDGGRTWGPIQVVADDGPNTFGNPCAIVDRDTGTIWLLLTHNLGQDRESEIVNQTGQGTRSVLVTYSRDEGLTWAPIKSITEQVKRPDWTWYATGPGVGIPLRSGRLVIPCDHIEAGTTRYYSHVIYSDDHGKTWQIGGRAGPQVNECQVVERSDGTLLLNMRSHAGKQCRALSTSDDGGLTWPEVTLAPELVDPVCQASLIRSDAGTRTPLLLFSNPASTRREKVTVRVSADEGLTWPLAQELHTGPSAYSCLGELADGSFACLYERGEKSPYEKITLARFKLVR